MNKKQSITLIALIAFTLIVTAYAITWYVDHLGYDGHIYSENANGLGHSVDFQPHYYAPGSNYAGTCGAPDGVYEQKDWGWPFNIDFPSEGGWANNVTEWSFAICDHTYLGPLHGTWKVVNGTSIPIWHKGVFPVDARLIITLKNNTIIDVAVKSQMCYGN